MLIDEIINFCYTSTPLTSGGPKTDNSVTSYAYLPAYIFNDTNLNSEISSLFVGDDELISHLRNLSLVLDRRKIDRIKIYYNDEEIVADKDLTTKLQNKIK